MVFSPDEIRFQQRHSRLDRESHCQYLGKGCPIGVGHDVETRLLMVVPVHPAAAFFPGRNTVSASFIRQTQSSPDETPFQPRSYSRRYPPSAIRVTVCPPDCIKNKDTADNNVFVINTEGKKYRKEAVFPSNFESIFHNVCIKREFRKEHPMY